MRVPDETLYKKGQRRIQDIPGFVLCLNCIHCPMATQRTIAWDGKWKCEVVDPDTWRDGNDIIEYNCSEYERRQCRSCKKYHVWCSSLNEEGSCNQHSKRSSLALNCVGRTTLSGIKNPKILEAEYRYARWKEEQLEKSLAVDDIGDRSEQEWTGTLEEENDEFIQVSEPDEEDKVCLTAEAEG